MYFFRPLETMAIYKKYFCNNISETLNHSLMRKNNKRIELQIKFM